ncbi:hypothetical protein AN6762.2 [Aspergillus nidulans FGSC A4]|uniref:Zn(II)2Cys6 transcription factor (Eurofung) n=1 Tax=Emericella nidulans (strain FGSC A4 / ATCC 38163 / CBS 112.46 / NRRL 194 / M139) TaxID=227321 RepID=Q5AY68_EMENI|nr:hypothetical protein [Aspergillus nidulans FGSC A4]EAA58580.1 hypothetical protein AN6762.2 [Aspergillus nidulans FGSC A4]CBF71409.1 TPA: Putative Zn(II)2Cys6 transcription factor (Eurofung) [Aspergillus nidulans FGSC A4]|eukprot:XP_664366.1 hypothetical protein AN6762.2 [Aspergillus nidulans FGSC A4]
MPLRRAKQACIHCHGRRIRCNVLQQRPCSNCVAQDVPCEVGVSRRGKYPRKKTFKSGHVTQIGRAVRASEPSSSASPTTSSTLHAAKPRIHDSTVFLGESSPLTSVMDPTQPPRLHYPLPDRLAPTSTRDEAVRLHQVQQAAQLESNGALSFPPEATVDALLQAYFRWFHPCFPIVDRAAICRARTQPGPGAGLSNIPPLLLQSMLFIGVSLCDDETFAKTEFPVRYRAKFLFYSRAKAIYEADAEASPIVKLQALFMLSFWRGGPSEERDVPILGSIEGEEVMETNLTRDQQSAAALGLPPRIRDEDGDVAMLEPDDVVEGETAEGDIFGRQTPQDLVYPVEMAKLARLLRMIVSTQYLHHQRPDLATRNALNEQLYLWNCQLPVELRLDNVSPDSLFLTGLLHMTYHDGWLRITHAFSTLCIHTIHHRRNCGTMRTLAEHRARLCLLSLEELQKSWDLENWVLHLFFRGLDDRTAESLRRTRENQVEGESVEGNDVDSATTMSTVTGSSSHVSGPGTGTSTGTGTGDMLMPMPAPQDDWYGWVPFEDEADALNLQNLEFLYRFL